ncbi:MAG: tyrosine-type recombinase/integrase [Caldilineales bacterium]|nr:tyrosine-type recombinase/integrase [Caldilineales bacterium]
MPDLNRPPGNQPPTDANLQSPSRRGIIIPFPGRPRPQPAPTPTGMTLASAFDSFLLDAEARRLTQASLRFYRQQIGYFLNYLQGQGVFESSELSAETIRAYLVSRQRRGLKDHSIHAAARAIRAFCNFLVREEVLQASPMAKVRMPRVSQQDLPAFTATDIDKLIATCYNPRDRAIVLFLIDTGCRAAEFITLNIGDVNLDSGEVRILEGKGRRSRTTYIGDKTRLHLQRYLCRRPRHRSDHPLWVSSDSGERLTRSGLRQLLQRLGERAEVEHCHPHTFRRTFALWSLRSGMNIYALQRLMGHSDLQVLRRYLPLAEDDLLEAHRQHGAVDHVL